MKVGIELFRTLCHLAEHQTQIFTDSADTGIPSEIDNSRVFHNRRASVVPSIPQILNRLNYNYLNIPQETTNFLAIQQIVLAIINEGFVPKYTDWGDINKNGGRLISFFFAWEIDENNPKLLRGNQVDVSYQVTKSAGIKFFNINIYHTTLPQSDWLRPAQS